MTEELLGLKDFLKDKYPAKRRPALCKDKVRQIRHLLAKKEDMTVIAEKLGICYKQVRRVKQRISFAEVR